MKAIYIAAYHQSAFGRRTSRCGSACRPAAHIAVPLPHPPSGHSNTAIHVDNPSTTMPSSSSSDAIGIGELLALRNDNAHRERRFYGASADKEIVKEPVYDVKVLDKLDKIVTRAAREIRLLEQALKATNAKTMVDTYSQDDGVLGELS
jgi:hypothetical protein